jgi:hypothetical protein
MSRCRDLAAEGWLTRDIGEAIRVVEAPARQRSVVHVASVRFDPGIRKFIDRQLFDNTLEDGGWLWGFVEPGGKVRVTHASAAAKERGRSRVVLNGAGTSPTLDHGLIRLGDWHSHPSGNARPSERDREVWTSRFGEPRADTGALAWAGIVVGAKLGTRPRFVAYATDLSRTIEITL